MDKSQLLQGNLIKATVYHIGTKAPKIRSYPNNKNIPQIFAEYNSQIYVPLILPLFCPQKTPALSTKTKLRKPQKFKGFGVFENTVKWGQVMLKDNTSTSCPSCGQGWIVKFGKAPGGKQRYRCRNNNCTTATFQISYVYVWCIKSQETPKKIFGARPLVF